MEKTRWVFVEVGANLRNSWQILNIEPRSLYCKPLRAATLRAYDMLEVNLNRCADSICRQGLDGKSASPPLAWRLLNNDFLRSDDKVLSSQV